MIKTWLLTSSEKTSLHCKKKKRLFLLKWFTWNDFEDRNDLIDFLGYGFI